MVPRVGGPVLPGGSGPKDSLSSIIVQVGDTLHAIADRVNHTVQDLLAANPQVKNPDNISPGQELKLPKFVKQADASFPETIDDDKKQVCTPSPLSPSNMAAAARAQFA